MRKTILLLGCLVYMAGAYAVPGNDTIPVVKGERAKTGEPTGAVAMPGKTGDSVGAGTAGMPGKTGDSVGGGTAGTTGKTDGTMDAGSKSTFDAEAATQQYLNSLPAEKKKKSDAYFEGGYWLILWSILYDALVVWLLLEMGLSRQIRKLAGRFKNVNVLNAVYACLYFLLTYLLHFPFNVYRSFFREHQYDLSNQTFLQWWGEDLVSLALTAVFGSLALVGILAAARRAKANWWIWGGGIAIVFLVIVLIVGPVFVSPLFNKYKPLEPGPLKEQILSMARANQVPADNVYEFDASRQSDRISANVSGFASTTRVSLNDNLLKRCTPAEVRSVMGHELGHYVLNHVYKGLVEMGLVVFAAFFFVDRLFGRIVRRYGVRWGISGVSDAGGLPLLIFLFSVYFFFATPVTNSITRSQEVEADFFGLNTAREPDGFAAIAMKLSEYRKIDPGYWEEVIFFDHPSGRNRVWASMIWKKEHLDR